VTDADWDALGDRVGPLARELTDVELEALLEGVAAALAAHGALAHAGAELRAIAERLLELVAGRWAERPLLPIGLDLLGAWLRLRATAGSGLSAPDLRSTWAELVPSEWLEDDNRVRDWQLLIRTLTEYEPEALKRLGYGRRHRSYLASFAETDVLEGDEPGYVALEPPGGWNPDIVDVHRILADLA
jgi:hypothetical protein